MKFRLEGPSDLEVKSREVTEDHLEIVPVTIRGQHTMRAGYLTAVGDGGAESKAVVLFNANTGEFSLQKASGSDVAFAFDRPVAEFEKRRDAMRVKGRKNLEKARRQTNPPREPSDAPTN